MGEISIAFNHIADKKKVRELSVVVYADSFFYGLWDEGDQLVFSDSGKLNELNELIRNQSEAYELKIVRIMSTLKPYVHVPSEEYEEQYFGAYFKGVYDLEKCRNKHQQNDTFLREEINTLHFLNSQFVNSFSETDVLIKKAHISTALANYAYLIDAQYVSYIAQNTLHICASKENKFQFYNQFDCYHEKDFLYFYMLTMKNLQLDPASEIVHIGGQLTQDSPTYELLYAYINSIQLRDNEINIQLPENCEKQFYFDLYLCKACV